MKTLRESILKSVKAGMHSMDPKNIRSGEDLHEYAKMLYGNLVKDIIDYNSTKYFYIEYNNKLTLKILTTRYIGELFEARCIFEENNRIEKEIYWSMWETSSDGDFKTLLRPEKLLEKDQKYYTKLIEKYKKKLDRIRRSGKLNWEIKERATLEGLAEYERRIRNIEKVKQLL